MFLFFFLFQLFRNSRWSSMRGAIQPLYQPSRIASQVPLMERTICILKDHLCTKDEKEDINFSELLLKVATDIIGEAAFGERFDLTQSTSQSTSTHPVQGEVSKFVKQHVYSTTSLKMDLTGTFSIIMGILFPVLQEPFRQILSRIPGTGDWKVEQNNRKLTDRLNAIVAKRSKDLGLESRTDFLSSVLNARESSKDSRDLFSPDYISALTYEHLLAGSATTSFTLSMVLYLVSAHPHVENKLLQEIDAFGAPDRNPTAEDLDKFPYLTQVSNWFINARVRLWKPMVEEMYMEETKEAELGHALTEKHIKENVENKEEVKSDEGPGNSHYRQEQKHTISHLGSNIQDVVCEEQNMTSGSFKSEHSSDSNYNKNRTLSMEEASDEEVIREVQDEGASQGHLKKARNGIEDNAYQFAPNIFTMLNFKLEESCPADTCDNKFNEGRHNNEDYSVVQNHMVLADVNGSSGAYQLGCINGYEQDSFMSRFSGSGGVSLTLGLQQSDGASFSRNQQNCMSNQGRTNGIGRTSDGNCNIMETGVANAADAYDSISLQNRKHYGSHPM